MKEKYRKRKKERWKKKLPELKDLRRGRKNKTELCK